MYSTDTQTYIHIRSKYKHMRWLHLDRRDTRDHKSVHKKVSECIQHTPFPYPHDGSDCCGLHNRFPLHNVVAYP